MVSQRSPKPFFQVRILAGLLGLIQIVCYNPNMSKEGILLALAQKLVGSRISVQDRTGYFMAQDEKVTAVGTGEDGEVRIKFEHNPIHSSDIVNFKLGEGMKITKTVRS